MDKPILQMFSQGQPFSRNRADDDGSTAPVLRQKRLHGLERILVVLLGLWTGILPWAFGTMHGWSQLLSLALACLAFGAALWPRHYTSWHTGGPGYRLLTWPKLLKFPLFWIGLPLFLYIALQAMNPAWEYTRNSTHWWLIAQQPMKWLPSSLDTPFEQMNAWRQLAIWVAPWLAACAAWIGLTRRLPAQILAGLVALNGVLVAALGLAQRATGSGLIYWKFDFLGASEFSSFVYKNHAAAFLLPALAANIGFSLWFAARGRRRQERSTPAPLFALGAILIYAALLVSQSRLGTILGTVILLGLPAGHLWQTRRESSGLHNWPLILTIVLLLTAFAGSMVASLGWNRIESRFAGLLRKEGDFSVRMRLFTFEATRRMAADHWFYGIGAGGYRFLFPEYQKTIPEIKHRTYKYGKNGAGRYYRHLFFDHAHNDFLHVFAELGLVGCAFLLAGAAVVMSGLTGPAMQHPLCLGGLISFFLLLAYGLLDFPWHNPAVVGSLAVFLCSAVRWSELEHT